MSAAVSAAITLLPILADGIGKIFAYVKQSGELTPDALAKLKADVHARADPVDKEMDELADAAEARIKAKHGK